MFTGLVEELGTVVAVDRGEDSLRLTIRAARSLAGVDLGDSVAVNGCCLTVARLGGAAGELIWTADVMAETLSKTTIGDLSPGDRVNLERALAAGDRLGGHLVQGHVDGVAVLTDRTPGDDWELVGFELPGELAEGVVPKGSITIDGVSLTVVAAPPVEGGRLTVSLIPETLQRTTLGFRVPGERVNVEVDVLGKYVARQVDVAVRRALAELRPDARSAAAQAGER